MTDAHPWPRWPRFSLLATIFCLSSGCSFSERPAEPPRPVVALVGASPIYADELKREYERVRLDRDQGLPSVASANTHKRALLNDLIDRRLLQREAEKNNTFVGTDQVEAAFGRIRTGWQDAELESLLSDKDTTAVELKRELRDMLVIREYLRRHVFSRVAVTDAEVEAHMAQHDEVFVEPEQIRARQIVVKTEEEALQIAKEIQRGMPFEDAAMKYSLSPDRASGGDLGFFGRGDMPRSFDDACFSLNLGEVSKVVGSVYGYHLFQMVERRPKRQRADAEVREQVEQRLRRAKERSARLAKIEELRQKAGIEIQEDILAQLR